MLLNIRVANMTTFFLLWDATLDSKGKEMKCFVQTKLPPNMLPLQVSLLVGDDCVNNALCS